MLKNQFYNNMQNMHNNEVEEDDNYEEEEPQFNEEGFHFFFIASNKLNLNFLSLEKTSLFIKDRESKNDKNLKKKEKDQFIYFYFLFFLFFLDVIEYARYLGMDPEKDADYLDIALEGLHAPLPEGWESIVNEEGEEVFVNMQTQEMSYNHPLDEYYRQLYLERKEKDLKKKEKEMMNKKKNLPGKLESLAPISKGGNKLQPLGGEKNNKFGLEPPQNTLKYMNFNLFFFI